MNPKEVKKDIFNWGNDWKSCICTNIDKNGCFFVLKSLVVENAIREYLNWMWITILVPLIVQVSCMNVKISSTPFLANWLIIKNTVKYFLMKYIENQQFATKKSYHNVFSPQTNKTCYNLSSYYDCSNYGGTRFYMSTNVVCSLKHERLFDQTSKVINSVY